MIKTTTNEMITNLIESMTVDEMKERLAQYMLADETVCSRPIGVEVRLKETADRQGRYEVIMLMADDSEVKVKFTDRPSKLIYIYTLLHPEGFQRRSLADNNYRPLRELFCKLYFMSDEVLLKAVEGNFDQYISQAVAQSRVSIRKAIGHVKDFEIDLPQRNSGRTVINHAAKGGIVIIDNSLR
jgi:hypothetical protein